MESDSNPGHEMIFEERKNQGRKAPNYKGVTLAWLNFGQLGLSYILVLALFMTFFNNSGSAPGKIHKLQKRQGGYVVQPTCEDNWSEYDGKCYIVISTPYAWQEAKDNCDNLGATLIVIYSQGLQNFLCNLGHPTWDDTIWTAANDMQIEGDWVWNTTGQRMSDGYTNWDHRTNEPNNNGGDEDCGCIWEYCYWNDIPCGLKRRSFCVKPLA